MRLRELMTESFSLIGESESIDEARSKLAGNDYLVVTSDEGLPLTVITMADVPNNLQGTLRERIRKLPPTVLIGCELDVSTIYDAPTTYLFKRKSRGAALLSDEGLVGIVPEEAIRSYLKEHPSKSDLLRKRGWRKLPEGRAILFNFEKYGSGMVGANPTRSFHIAATGTLGGSRILPTMPRVCGTCGWPDVYTYVHPATKCKNPDPTVGPQPWPHPLA